MSEASAELVHGTHISQMLLYPEWVHRRVEQITFVDEETVRRRVSVDFEIPSKYANPVGLSLDTWFAPLALLRKGSPLVDFDLLDEEGRSLPLLATDEGHQIAAAALVSRAGAILEESGGGLNSSLTKDLQAVASCERRDAREAVRRALEPQRGTDPRRFLARDPHMPRLVDDLARNFLVLTPIEDPAQRRVIKLSFLESFRRPSYIPLRVLGWRKTELKFVTGGAGMARSYHCEIGAPERLEIMQANLSEIRASGAKINDRRSACGNRVHLQLTNVPSDTNAVLQADLRATRRGLPSMSAVLGVAVSLLLTAGVVFHASALKAGDTTAALLVAIPALLAAYLSRPGEHELATRLLIGIRWLTALIGLLVFIAAASLVAEPKHDRTVLTIWIVLAASSWLATAALIASAVLPRPPRGSEITE